MLKKTILVENKTVITTKQQQLILKSEIRESSIPIEDIGFLVIDNNEIFISIPAMNLLIENNSAVIICNASHLPNGMFLNLNSHHIQQEIFRNQIEASIPLKNNYGNKPSLKNNKSRNTTRTNYKKQNNFEFIASKVLSGDTTNMEGVAANQYWKPF